MLVKLSSRKLFRLLFGHVCFYYILWTWTCSFSVIVFWSRLLFHGCLYVVAVRHRVWLGVCSRLHALSMTQARLGRPSPCRVRGTLNIPKEEKESDV